MGTYTYNAYAKINITLDIVGKREDGYHLLEMIMTNVALKDVVTIEKVSQKGVFLDCSRKDLPCDERNIAYRAAKQLMDRFGIDCGVKIYIEKNIPMAAGLAGGSTDAAAVLRGMNEIYGLGMSEEQLCAEGVRLGADVPYCICGRTSLAEGIGERLTFLKKMPHINVVLAKPDIDVSTAFVYKNYRAENTAEHPETDKMVAAVNSGDMKTVAEGLCNVLESVTIPAYPVIADIKKEFTDCGAAGTLMSGSGPTVFAFFEDGKSAEKAADRIRKKFDIKEVYLTNLI